MGAILGRAWHATARYVALEPGDVGKQPRAPRHTSGEGSTQGPTSIGCPRAPEVFAFRCRLCHGFL
jgi:hypothetical protein